jgi:hypothetical protein
MRVTIRMAFVEKFVLHAIENCYRRNGGDRWVGAIAAALKLSTRKEL